MTTIRPSVQPPIPQGAPVRDDAKMAAARAFFAAAMGQAPAPAAATASPATSAQTAVAQTAAPSSNAPQRIPRPGSLIDIRV